MEHPSSFIEFTNSLHNMVDNMTILKHEGYLNDQRLQKDLASKLPSNIKNKCILDTFKTPDQSKTLRDLSEFLKESEDLAAALMTTETNYNRQSSINMYQSSVNSCLICNR